MDTYSKNCYQVPTSEPFLHETSKSTSTILEEDLIHAYVKIAIAKKGFVYQGTHLWSTINRDFQTIQDTQIFVKKFKTYMQSILIHATT